MVLTDKVLMVSGMAAAAVMAAQPAALAHDAFADGTPILAGVKLKCCAAAHVHHIANEAVHVRSDGDHVDGYRWTVPMTRALRSSDGSIWLFYTTFMDGTVAAPFCFFVGQVGA